MLLVLVGLVGAACGFRGPLYLPGEAPTEPGSQQSAGSGETDSQDEDPEDEEEQINLEPGH